MGVRARAHLAGQPSAVERGHHEHVAGHADAHYGGGRCWLGCDGGMPFCMWRSTRFKGRRVSGEGSTVEGLFAGRHQTF
jgi:hypothetical protein